MTEHSITMLCHWIHRQHSVRCEGFSWCERDCSKFGIIAPRSHQLHIQYIIDTTESYSSDGGGRAGCVRVSVKWAFAIMHLFAWAHITPHPDALQLMYATYAHYINAVFASIVPCVRGESGSSAHIKEKYRKTTHLPLWGWLISFIVSRTQFWRVSYRIPGRSLCSWCH